MALIPAVPVVAATTARLTVLPPIVRFRSTSRRRSSVLASLSSPPEAVDWVEATSSFFEQDTRPIMLFDGYGRKYQSSEEMKHMYSIFAQSLETIRLHNSKWLSYTLGVNEYADMTWEEFRKNKLGAAQHCSATKKGNHKLTIREGLMIYIRVDHYSQKIRPICYQFMDHLANIKE